jgi:ribonuclease III
MKLILTDYIKSPGLLTESLTHRSYCNEHPGATHNERLEFLGDSVLSLVISDRLFRALTASPEGELTSRRSFLVQTTTLAKKSLELGLDSQLLLSRGEEESGGRSNPGLLANTFEAVLGAIFIDSGLDTCYRFLQEIFPDEILLSEEIKAKDPKSMLQELSQANGWGTPTYEITATTGPDHARQFTISVNINGQSMGLGSGASKQKAETQAAAAALSKISPPVSPS